MKLFLQLNQPIVRKHILISSLGITLGLLLYYYIATSEFESVSYSFLEVLLSAIYGVLTAYTSFAVSKKMDQIIPWKTQLASRFLIGIFINFLVVTILIIAFAKASELFILSEPIVFNSPENVLIKLTIILFILMLLYNIIYFALYSYYTYATLQIETIKFDRKQIDLQLKALKSQLSSHFLFNNLNTISSLAIKDPKMSESYIRGLSKIYNYTLKSYDSKLVLLQEELEFVNSYLLLLQIRFGAVFNYNIDIPESLMNSRIPPLTLQMLIENAIKHNQMNSENPLQISVSNEENYISVTNNITESPKKVSSFQIGLNNINMRYKLLCNQGIHILKTDSFTVKIPVIH